MKKIVQKSLRVKNTQMKMTSVNKVQFASLNDKRYYFLDGIVSLPFENPLNPIRKYILLSKKTKDKLLKLEKQAVAKNERLKILRNIY